jgi:hypothetical protein
MNRPIRKSARFVHDRLARDGAVGKRDALVARMAGPFIDILEQVPMNGPEVIGVELAFAAMSQCNFSRTGLDKAAFKTLKLVVVGRTESVLDGVGAGIGVVGHALADAIMDFETGDDVGRVDLSALKSLEDRIGCGVAIYVLDAVVGLSVTERFPPPRDFLGADARLGPGADGDVVHVASPSK